MQVGAGLFIKFVIGPDRHILTGDTGRNNQERITGTIESGKALSCGICLSASPPSILMSVINSEYNVTGCCLQFSELVITKKSIGIIFIVMQNCFVFG